MPWSFSTCTRRWTTSTPPACGSGWSTPSRPGSRPPWHSTPGGECWTASRQCWRDHPVQAGSAPHGGRPGLKVDLKVQRYDPASNGGPVWGVYQAEVEDNGRVLDALHYVKWYVDGTLA